ncbi:MAG: VTT domain-containing protein [Chloroflexota bacterium]
MAAPLATPRRRSRWGWAIYIFLFLAMLSALTMGMLEALSMVERLFQSSLAGLAYYAYGAVFLVTLVSSAMVVLPAPGLAFVLAAATRWDPTPVALAASLGGTLGEVTGYLLGRWAGAAIARRRPALYLKAEGWMKRYGLAAVWFFAFFPLLMFDFVGIAAGALRFPLWKFLLVVWAARLPRSFIEVYTGGAFFGWLASYIG